MPSVTESGRKAQISNIQAAKTVADVIRTCLGPKAMMKMVCTCCCLTAQRADVVTTDPGSYGWYSVSFGSDLGSFYWLSQRLFLQPYK